MGSIISHIEDLYEEYVILCEEEGIIPKEINSPYWVDEYFKLINKENE